MTDTLSQLMASSLQYAIRISIQLGSKCFSSHNIVFVVAATYCEAELVAPVLQFVITGVEGEGLHDVGPSPQELPVQLSH